MRRKAVSIVIITAILIIVSYLIWDISQLRPFAGTYISIDAEDSTYELTLSGTGRISITDIGAGNPALNGFVYTVPDSNNHFRIRTFGETDSSFLGLKDTKTAIWLSSIRHQDDEQSSSDYNVIVLEASDSMQFNEKGYE